MDETQYSKAASDQALSARQPAQSASALHENVKDHMACAGTLDSSESIADPSFVGTTMASSPIQTLAEDLGDPSILTCDDVSRLHIKAGYIAIGTIFLYFGDDDSDSRLFMRSPTAGEPYPSSWLSAAIRRGWVRVEEVKGNCMEVKSYLRVFVLPEDVGRGTRGSLKDFRKIVKRILDLVNPSSEAWTGKMDVTLPHSAYEVPSTAHEESLFYIFNTLRSPRLDLDYFRMSTYGFESVKNVMNGTVAGLNTTLYAYQQRSVATMIQREAEPAKILDPRKPVYNDVYGNPFYLDVHEGTLHISPPLYNEPQGGILAETMGYGKTLICITLILATRGHYPKVPEDRIDNVSFPPQEKVGSLLSMAARRTKHEGVPWKTDFSTLSKSGYHFDRCLDELKKYDRAYAEPVFTPTTPDRQGKRESANIVRLCSATLVIVPPNLLTQWQNEIVKHTKEDALDVLVVDSPTKRIPCWQELLTYDVIIITKARFEQEYRDDDLNLGKTKRGEARYRSSLTEVRWLRVICDEGHGFAGSSSRTNAMAMLDKMYIERRWVVSGTPSSTLHGVEVGLSTTTSSGFETGLSTTASSSIAMRKSSLNTALQKRRAPSSAELEAKDLERLRLIVVNFLRLQPWANQRGSSDVANWKRYLAPFTDVNGVRRNSSALRDVLQSLIIRHRIEDIDTDLTLPPLHNKVVYLEPSYHDKLAINMFFLVLVSNYVTSEREDEDYMFHPKNRKKLDQLINNLRQASFHWVGFTQHDIRKTLRISNEYFDKNVDKISDADGVLFKEAILNGERALADPSWQAFSTLHEIGVYIKQFPDHARESWALDGRDNDPVLLGTVQAREVQRYIREASEKNQSDVLSGLAGAGVRAMNAAKNRAELEQVQQRARTRVDDGEKQQVGATEEPKLKATSTSLASPLRSSNLKPPISTTLVRRKRKRGETEAESALITPPSSPMQISEPSTLHQPHPALANTYISSFTSSKLTYLTSRLLSLPPSTRSLVFYQHNNTAFFIAEALELLGIPHRIYASTLSVAQRNTYLAEFNSKATEIQVLLMDIKQASHGLHIACASYVCIVSPIWDASIESQAIKRAHRIGQTKEVVVETLVLSGTFEQEMVQRRRWKDENLDLEADQDPSTTHQLQSPNYAHLTTKERLYRRGTGKTLLDDRHMVSVLKDIQFMRFSQEEEDTAGRTGDMDVSVNKRLLCRPMKTSIDPLTMSTPGQSTGNPISTGTYTPRE